MKLINGSMSVVYDLNMAMNALQNGCKVIYLGDPTGCSDPMILNNFIMGTMFLPRMEFMQELVSGDNESFKNHYINQLYSDPNIFEFLKTIIIALHQGVNIIIYIPQESLGFGFHQLMFNTIYNMCGIHPQMNQNDSFFIDTTYTQMIAELLYCSNFLTLEQFIGALPLDVFTNDQLFHNMVSKVFGHGSAHDKVFTDFIISLKKAMVESNQVLRPLMVPMS